MLDTLRRISPALALLVLAKPSIAPATVPSGFVDLQVEGGFVLPVALEFDPQGRIWVAEKRGMVWIVENESVLPTPAIDLVDEVHDASDKGLLGMALDPDFANNGYLYLLYMVDPIPGQPDEPGESVTWGRLTRYTVQADTADVSSRLVLLGNDATDGIANCDKSHAIGALVFGEDGSLFVSAGDGAHYEFTDGGQDVQPHDPDCAAIFGAQDVGALRAQNLDSLAGKILRVDPATGLGFAGNPFYDGDPASFPSRIWARGLRNPFRFTVRPGTPGPGTLYISDVGWSEWEELDVSTGGENFGWPCYEGFGPQPLYQTHNLTTGYCSALDSTSVTPPAIAWNHDDPGSLGFIGNAASGITFYTRTEYPVTYWDRCFFSDYGANWIKVAQFDSLDQLVSIDDFADGLSEPVDLAMDPTNGDLVYASITTGAIRKIQWAAGNIAPVVIASANPTSGPPPLEVQFSSDGTYDPNGDPITVEWDFGDGSPVTTDPNPMHTFTDFGLFTVWLTAWDDSGNVDSASVVIDSFNNPPSVQITSPLDGYVFMEDEVIPLTATASDPEDGSNVTYDWDVTLVHNDHPHPGWFTSSSPTTQFTASAHGVPGDRFSYRIHLTVSDTQALSSADTVVIVPDFQGANQPPIAAFTIDDHDGPAPHVIQLDAGISVDPDNDMMIYTWDFGDGTTGSGENTTHIFGEAGMYTVSLVATDPAQASDTTTAVVRVEPGGALLTWDFDEGSGTTANDGSGNGRHGSVNGAGWVSGVKGTALEFDGWNDSVIGSGGSFLSNLPTFTFACWIRPSTTGSREGLMGQNDAIEFGFISPNNIQIWTPNGGNVTVGYPYPMSEWHHVAAVGDGTGIVVYYDGSPVASNSNSASTYGSSTYGVNVGGGGVFDGSGNHFDGRIDEVRIYGPALSDQEIASLATLPPPNSAPLVSAGLDLEAVVDEEASLLGTATDDGLPAPPGQVTVLWTQVEGPSTVNIFNPTALFTMATFPDPGTYVLELAADDGEMTTVDSVTVTVNVPTDILGFGASSQPGIHRIAPNPLRDQVLIRYGVPRDGANVRLTIHSVDGRRVRSLLNGPSAAGYFNATWTSRDQSGRRVTSGVYFVSLEIDGTRYTKKLTVLR